MKYTLVILLFAILFSTCTGISSTGNSSSEKKAADNLFIFKAGGEEINSTGWNLGLYRLKTTGEIQLGISSNIHRDSRTLNAVIGGIIPGTYIFEENSITTYGNYFPDYNKDQLNSFSFVSGSFIITQLDTVRHIINAQFSGTVKNSRGQQLAITEGKIVNGKLNEKIETF